MKLFFLFTFIYLLFLSSVANAAEKADWGENSDVFNKGFENQQAVSDSKMKNTIKMLKERQLSYKQRKIRREVKPNAPMYDVDYLKSFTDENSPDNELNNSLTVMIPMSAYSDDGKYIQPGYYKLSCRKVSTNDYVLDLSQGNTVVLSVPALQTKEDLNQEGVSFCNAEVIDNGRVRLMYGTIDLNLVGYIYFK